MTRIRTTRHVDETAATEPDRTRHVDDTGADAARHVDDTADMDTRTTRHVDDTAGPPAEHSHHGLARPEGRGDVGGLCFPMGLPDLGAV